MRFDAVVAPAKDEGEFNFLQSLVAGVFPEDRPYWLGADDRETEGEWTWEDGSPVTYAVWAVGARNPLTADGTDCLVVGASGKWKDNECDKLRRFVCKKPPTFVPAVSSGPPAEFVTTATTVETTPVATALPPDVIDDVIDQPDLITLTLPWATTNGYPPTASVPQPQQGCPDSEIYVSGNSGLLESPGYPEMYPNNCDVTYYVTLDQAGPQTVELSYDDFDLEWHSQCAYDSLVVDGDEDNPQCGVKTGQNMDVEVDGNSFTVKFYSDGSVINRGFSISYSVQGGGCPQDNKDWRLHGDSCYAMRNRRYTYDEAMADCDKFGAVVAIINDEAEFSFLQNLTAEL
nr:hypothetical protein BaRGS_012522 [Batillaria attramentaria]